MKRRVTAILSATAVTVVMAASPVLAANAAPGNSDFVGGGSGAATTSNCAPASVSGCAQN